MEYEVKVLQRTEVELLKNVETDVFDDAVIEKASRDFLENQNHHLVVAVSAEKIIGFVSAVHYLHPDKENPEFWINEVGVSPNHQGKKIGKALMKRALELASELGCPEAWVLTEKENQAACGLYRSSGGEASDCVMYSFITEE